MTFQIPKCSEHEEVSEIHEEESTVIQELELETEDNVDLLSLHEIDIEIDEKGEFLKALSTWQAKNFEILINQIHT